MPKKRTLDASGNYAPALSAGGPVIPAGAFHDLTNSIASMFGLPTYSPGTNAFYGGPVGSPGPKPPMSAALDFGAPSSLPPGYDATQGQKTFKYTGPTNLPGTQPAPQFDPAASFNNQTPPPPLPGLNTGGVNQYLTDPLMAMYRRQNNPLYANQQKLDDFYGDPELFNAPTAMGAI